MRCILVSSFRAYIHEVYVLFLLHIFLLPPFSPPCCQVFHCRFTSSPYRSPSSSSSLHLSPDPTDSPHGLPLHSTHVRAARVTSSLSSACLRPPTCLVFLRGSVTQRKNASNRTQAAPSLSSACSYAPFVSRSHPPRARLHSRCRWSCWFRSYDCFRRRSRVHSASHVRFRPAYPWSQSKRSCLCMLTLG